jgi:aminoglycoside phosphotransferase (APT) family kinase protein
MSVRLPSDDRYVSQVDKEHRWLPFLARRLPLPIPEPLARGRPTPAFPRPWSVYRWREGQPATLDAIPDLAPFACDLADFLDALYRIDATAGPVAGAHSFNRGGPVPSRNGAATATIEALESRVDVAATLSVWQAAVESSPSRRPVWVHGDITGSNLLVRDGELAAVIDFGCCAVGDPACDLTIAWTLLHGRSRELFRRRIGLDDDAWARARGWGLWKALVTIQSCQAAGRDPDAAAVRFGWRIRPHEVIDEIVADFYASG